MSHFTTKMRRIAHQRRALSAWNRRVQAVVSVARGLYMRRLRDPVFWISNDPFVEVSRQTLLHGWVSNYHATRRRGL
mgnify:CR=1 FL=1